VHVSPGATINLTYPDRDACGVGFVADALGRPSREIVDGLLAALHGVRHRGAPAPDPRDGDGAGLILPLVAALQPEPGCGLAMVFLRDEAARAPIEEACAAEGLDVVDWRIVPIDAEQLGPVATATAPRIEQAVLRRPAGPDEDELEWRAYRARKRA
jgi:glutamate synthase (NADPH/NADH) large chain